MSAAAAAAAVVDAVVVVALKTEGIWMTVLVTFQRYPEVGVFL